MTVLLHDIFDGSRPGDVDFGDPTTRPLEVPSDWNWSDNGENNNMTIRTGLGLEVNTTQSFVQHIGQGTPIALSDTFSLKFVFTNRGGQSTNDERIASMFTYYDVGLLSFIGFVWQPTSVPQAIISYSDPTETIFDQVNPGITSDQSGTETLTAVLVVSPTQLDYTITVVDSLGTHVTTGSIVADFSWAVTTYAASLANDSGFLSNRIYLQEIQIETSAPPSPGDPRGFALDMKPTGFGLIELGHHAIAAHSDPLTDKLYLVLDLSEEPDDPYLPIGATTPALTTPFNHIYEFDSADATSDLTYRYRGKLNLLERPAAFVYCQVKAADYDNLVLNVYGDGDIIFSTVVTSREPFTLPIDSDYEEFEFEVIGTSRVRSLQFVEDIRELK